MTKEEALEILMTGSSTVECPVCRGYGNVKFVEPVPAIGGGTHYRVMLEPCGNECSRGKLLNPAFSEAAKMLGQVDMLRNLFGPYWQSYDKV